MYDKRMNLREKVYQMFVLSPSAVNLIGDENLVAALKNGLGGIIFFTKNIVTVEQTKTLISDILSVSKIPPFLGIDEEGGRVERTENLFGGKKFLSARYQAEKGLKYVEKETTAISVLLKELGFNMNFAPVLDVNTNPANPIIGERAYSDKADEVSEFGFCAAKTYMDNRIIPVCKHFPGHGDAGVDSHLSLPEVKCSFSELENVHIKPFKAAIESGIPAIMAAHLYCPCFDEEKVPASLSKNVINYLRKDLNFNGVIVSDDMQMGALDGYTPLESVIKGIEAGVDLFLFRDCEADKIAVIEAVLTAAEKNDELRNNILKANERIFALKKEFKLL